MVIDPPTSPMCSLSGNCPEGGAIADYALIWFDGLRAYVRASGDLAAARLLLPRAIRCMGECRCLLA